MRLLTVGNMYPPHHQGGYELVWESAVEHLRAAGHDVSVLTTGHREPGVGAADRPQVHRDLRWWWRDHEWPAFSRRERLRVERHNARVLRERLAADRPDAVAWFSMGGMSLSLIEQVRRRGLPAVGVVHDDWLVYGPEVDQWLRQWRGRRTLGRLLAPLLPAPAEVDFSAAARWLFVSDYVRRTAREKGHDLADTAVAPSGIDAGWIGPLGEAASWRWRLLVVGRIDPRKGIHTAISALSLLPEATLRVVGEGDEAALARLREQAAEEGVADRVEFAGSRSRDALPAVYRAADVVLFPVVWEEPWGLVPLEAMACGVPVVATGRGGSGEYLRDGENCLLHEAGDAAALAERVRVLAGDPALRTRLREEGARTAPRHTDAVFNARLERAIADLV